MRTTVHALRKRQMAKTVSVKCSDFMSVCWLVFDENLSSGRFGQSLPEGTCTPLPVRHLCAPAHSAGGVA